MLIQSKDNSQIKDIRKFLISRKYRNESDFFIIDTKKLLFEILEKNPEKVIAIYTNSKEIKKNLSEYKIEKKIFDVSDKLMKTITSLKTGQNFIAKIKKPNYKKIDFDKLNNIILLDGVADPKNLGAIIRNAVAYEIDACFLLPNTVNPYHPNSIRAMAGSIFQIPIIEISKIDDFWDKTEFFDKYILDAHKGNNLAKVKFGNKNIFIFGSEGQGVNILSQKKQINYIKIEMSNKIESLNVASSAGILFYTFQITKNRV